MEQEENCYIRIFLGVFGFKKLGVNEKVLDSVGVIF